jgi:hydroxymethylbilane synthase
MRISVACRSSPLSKAQVKEVEEEIFLFFPWIRFACTPLLARGDLDLTSSLRDLDKTDFFTREIDALVLEGGCRISIHSAKDLPEPLPEGLKMVALTKGVDPSDVLLLREGDRLEKLKEGALIGSSSKRRDEALRKMRGDLRAIEVRGPIDQRIESLKRGEIDGLVVAKAALIRLGLTHLNFFPLPGETAPLQGKLAVLARAEDQEMEEIFSRIDIRKK